MQSEDRESLIAALYQGNSLRQSFHQIAKTWANQVNADRVSVVRLLPSRTVLIATSTNETVDRQARLANLLETFAAAARKQGENIEFTVGHDSARKFHSQPQLDQYVIESGCRRIEAVFVDDESNQPGPIALMVSEWFTATEPILDPTFQHHVQIALRTALNRDAAAWTNLLRRAGEGTFITKAAALGLLVCGIVLALWLIPVRFTIPADGRVVPQLHRRVFAPSAAIVTDIAVHNGQAVKQGQALFTLRSASLDLREEQIHGELLTAKTRLASLAASRSDTRRNDSSAAADRSSISASEESLKTEIAGLEKQLVLIAQQQQELTIVSPIDGTLDRWDLEQSLTLRPVAQGQYLADVYSTSATWVVELDLPDKHAGYVIRQGQSSPAVSFRLQSQPDQIFHATITDIAKSASLDPQGRSIIRLKCEFAPEQPERLAIGATVWADVDCGRRSLGFVWFRGLIEWWELQAWY